MPTPDLLPFPALLAPISGDAPTGSDPRRTRALSEKFGKIADAFTTASAVERKIANGESVEISLTKLWGEIISPATELLTAQTKDVEVAYLLAQAEIRVHGLPGLRDGLRLIRELAELYWDTIHPMRDPDAEPDAEPDDPEESKDARLLYIERLQSNAVHTALRLAPITAAKGEGPFSCDGYQKATRAELTTGNDTVAEDGRRQKAKILAAARDSGADYYLCLLDDLGLTMSHMDGLENFVMEKAGGSGLILGKLRETVGEIERAVRDISRGLIPEAAAPAAVGGPSDPDAPAGQPGTGGGFRASGSNAAQNREGALRSLAEIAAFFKTTEPHSPIGYTLDTLVARARMPLPALLADLITDDAARQAFLTTAGIRLPPDDA